MLGDFAAGEEWVVVAPDGVHIAALTVPPHALDAVEDMLGDERLLALRTSWTEDPVTYYMHHPKRLPDGWWQFDVTRVDDRG
jgi:hypothetical protein